MADLTKVVKIIDNPRECVFSFQYQYVDSGNESAVNKIDVSALAANARGAACNEVRIQEVWAQVFGFDGVRLWYDAGTDVVAFDMGPGWTHQDLSEVGGLKSYGTSPTGDILLSTLGTAASGDSYEIVIRAVKYYA